MKVVYITGNMAHYDRGLGVALQHTKNVLTELEAEIEIIDLGIIHPPYCDGEATVAVDNIIEKIKKADGLIFACTAQLFAPTALMQSFLEYLELPEYSGVLAGKHCMIITVSQGGGEKSATDYLSRVIQHLEGYSVAQIGLQAAHISEIGQAESAACEFVDKATEDFYRAAHKGRKYIIPADYAPGQNSENTEVPAPQSPPIEDINPMNTRYASQMQAKLNAFTEQQEKDIEELSRLFSKKYTDPGMDEQFPVKLFEDDAAVLDRQLQITDEPPAVQKPPPAAPRVKTAQQITQNLPHYFQPQLSAGIQSVIQINISGAETFEGFLYIHSTECTYTEGTAPAPDIILMADTAVWLDVLKNKHTAQKAFMIGGLKVRGDFVLLSKFDTLFKLEGV